MNIGYPPIPEEETALLGEEIKPPLSPVSSPEPAEQITTPSISSPYPVPPSDCHPSMKAKESWKWVKADTDYPGRWLFSYLKENDRVPEWWREFWSLIPSLNKNTGNDPVQRIACQQAMVFRLLATHIEQDGSWTALPARGHWGEGISFPQKISRELRIIEWCGKKRQWLWPRLYKDVSPIPGCWQECSAEQYRNCTSALPL